MTAATPSGVVTFLFTDVEGSTRRWEADADGMRVALAAHDEVLRKTIEAHGGWLFKHTGDGVCAVFTSPRAAVDAAVAAQQALELPVRMGISTGEAELRGSDYFGAVLNRAARVMAAGHGGQILLAESTAVLLSGVDLVDLGPRRLRDITDPVQVFQVRAPGLRTEFPPLATQDPASGNLRPPTTSLIGREQELDEVAAALKAHQVVTLTGVGGVGKTRLALEVAARSADNFPDGVWVIELAPVAGPAAVPEAFAAVLGIIQQPGLSLADSRGCGVGGPLAAVGGRQLRTRPRRRRRVDREHSGPLGHGEHPGHQPPGPAAGRRATVAGARPGHNRVDSAAITLFCERAEAVAPGISWAEDAGAVVEICRRLDGIPLAIELAASRMQSMTVVEVRDRLDDRFRLLVGSRRGRSRHHTLRHAVAWSYDLLDDAEQRLLRRCSVFAGGFDLAAACAVSGSDDEFVTLDLLDALVRKSLLVADRSSGRTRFSMLETIRQFADDQLVPAGEADEVHAAHARYFADQETRVLSRWDSPRQREAYAWFTVELANLRTAFRWAADHGDLDAAAAIATYAAILGIGVDNFEPIAWTEELIEPARAVDHPRLAFLNVLASQCWNFGRFEAAARYADDAQSVICSGRHEDVPFGAEGALGITYMAIGQPERGVEWCRAQLARGRDTHTLTRTYLVEALIVAGAGDEARAAANELIDAAEATRNPFALSFALQAYGYAFCDADPVRALEALRRGLVIAQDSGNRYTESLLATIVCRVEAEHGDPLAALDYVTLTIRTFHDAGNTTLMRSPLAILAAVLDRVGGYEPAATIAGFAFNPITATLSEFSAAIAHLREVLGDQTYESLARKGEAMTTAAMATYAYNQIDQARAELNAVS